VDVPKTCLGAVLTAFGEPLKIMELKIPSELERGSLLVKVEAATICGSDVHLWEGALSGTLPVPLPVIPGHEFVGRIVRFGEGVERDSIGTPLALGDRIVWTHESCDECRACRVEREPSLCSNRRHYMFLRCTEYPYLTGGFAEYCYVLPKSGRLRVPDEVKSEWASAASCALRSVMQGFERLGAISAWESVVIQGSGPLGLFATAVAKNAGAGQIIVVGGPEQRLDVAKSWGADAVVSVEQYDAESRATRISELTDGRGADIVMELSGAPGAFVEGIQFARRGGRYVVIGQVGPNMDTLLPADVTKKQLTILGSWSGHTAQYWQALEFIRRTRDRFNFDLLISSRFRLDEINTAIERMRQFSEIKPVVFPGAA
jgi:threonine dehydrogenase-like Zn-dependent dehydrogenase